MYTNSLNQNHVRIYGLSNSPGVVAILITKTIEMLQYGLTYTMRTSGYIWIPDSNVPMSDLAQVDIPSLFTIFLFYIILSFADFFLFCVTVIT